MLSRGVATTGNLVNQSHPLNRGLLGWWLAIPGQQGKQWRDLLGKYPATRVGTASASWTGPHGRPGGLGAMRWDGSAENMVTVGDAPVWSPYGNGTVNGQLSGSCWFRVENMTADHVTVSKAGTPGNHEYEFWVFASAARMYYSCYTTSNQTYYQFGGSTPIVINTWYHLVFVLDYRADESGSVRGYINGRSDGQQTTVTTPGTVMANGPEELRFGDRPGTVSITGHLDDIRMYNRLLSAYEAKQLYDLSRQGYQGLINRAVWRIGAVPTVTNFPSLVGTAVVTPGTTATQAAAVGLPPLATGNLGLILIRAAGAGAISITGWTSVFEGDADASDDRMGLFYRLADGTEGATVTATIGGGVNQKWGAIAWEFANAANPATQPPEVSTVAVGASNSLDPTTVTPTGGAKDYLYGIVVGADGEAVFSAYPTAYTIGQANTDSGTGGAPATNVRVAGAWQALNAASADPDAMLYTGTAATGWTAYAVAIHPVAVAGPILYTQLEGAHARGGFRGLALGVR